MAGKTARPQTRTGKPWKRTVDVGLSFVGLLLSLPLLAVVALLIRLDSRGPVFFTQDRLGRHGRRFRLYKLRTMTDRCRRCEGEVIPGDPEVTRVGRYLRRLKLDELPQLWNVLKGDMSIVGPRPGLPEQLEQLDETGKKRLEVRPGLTGLAQVHGNIYLPWEERWKYDARYVEKLSFLQDCWILWQTLFVCVKGEQRFVKAFDQERA
jgi:lipopolysaccharide/colanic/teichoic acid biosynthesis glycosyltransferase